jgi:TRAP-type C4-dicarboxylate transport system permease small subunit
MTRKVLEGASGLLAWVAGIALILMMLHIALDVTMRFFFSQPLNATIEIVTTYYMVAVVFLPLALVEGLNAHIVVELLTQHLGKRTQEILIGVVAIASALYFGAFTWQTWDDALQKMAVGEVTLGMMAVTVWPTRFYLPIGCGLITLMLIYKAIRLFLGDASLLRPKLSVAEEKAHS